MAEYIDRDALRARMREILFEIFNTPAADVVPVVRCKDCKWRTGIEEHTVWHPCDDAPVNDDWFCADGERRVDNG